MNSLIVDRLATDLWNLQLTYSAGSAFIIQKNSFIWACHIYTPALLAQHEGILTRSQGGGKMWQLIAGYVKDTYFISRRIKAGLKNPLPYLHSDLLDRGGP